MEPRRLVATELREGHSPVAARVEVHDRLGGQTDHLHQVAPARRREKRRWEAVGAIGGMTEAGHGERGRCSPTRQEICRPAQVGKERTSRMLDRVGSVSLEKGECRLFNPHAWSHLPRQYEKSSWSMTGDGWCPRGASGSSLARRARN